MPERNGTRVEVNGKTGFAVFERGPIRFEGPVDKVLEQVAKTFKNASVGIQQLNTEVFNAALEESNYQG